MRALVIYESMYGNTHQVADAIAEGLNLLGDVQVVAVAGVAPSMLEGADLVVVGGPTHAHGMSRESTRKSAVEAANKPAKGLHVEPGAADMGLRDWFESLGTVATKAAAFDTRASAPVVFTGHAGKGISKMLRDHGLDLIAQPESFLVDKENHLLPGERGRAMVWGERLVQTLAETRAAT